MLKSYEETVSELRAVILGSREMTPSSLRSLAADCERHCGGADSVTFFVLAQIFYDLAWQFDFALPVTLADELWGSLQTGLRPIIDSLETRRDGSDRGIKGLSDLVNLLYSTEGYRPRNF